jgi:hypothetical protein
MAKLITCPLCDWHDWADRSDLVNDSVRAAHLAVHLSTGQDCFMVPTLSALLVRPDCFYPFTEMASHWLSRGGPEACMMGVPHV